jgi:ABC-2 type transport system ATP-binding protein
VRTSVAIDTLEPAVRRELEQLGQFVETQAGRVAIDVEPARVPEAVARLLALPGASNLEVHDAPLEEVMRELFARRGARAGGEGE